MRYINLDLLEIMEIGVFKEEIEIFSFVLRIVSCY